MVGWGLGGQEGLQLSLAVIACIAYFFLGCINIIRSISR